MSQERVQAGVSSAGSPGVDLNRSFGRAYNNIEQRVDSLADLGDSWQKLVVDAKDLGRRRVVQRAHISPRQSRHLSRINPDIAGLSIDAMIPLSLIDPKDQGVIVYSGANFYPADVPEWQKVCQDWTGDHTLANSPLVHLRNTRNRYDIVSGFREEDQSDIEKIWAPFQWDQAGIIELNHRLEGPEKVWFSGIVDRKTDRLVSICMAETVQVGDVTLVETTEYGTRPDRAGEGLCTAAVSFLNAQILQDMYYGEGQKQLPLIYAELSMTSRSDRAARKAGFDIPFRENFQPDQPMMVLPHNVAVYDGMPPNDLGIANIPPKYHQAMGSEYPYYRNFIVGVLPRNSVNEYYSPEQVDKMLNLQGRATW